ncbi:MAG: hypothetical protein J6M92_04900 [Oribacterium sp.]|nr:hypothetical protein [Oribacterium sp.]
MFFYQRKYLHEASAGGGGGKTNTSGSGSSALVKIDVETYNGIVDAIEECKDAIIATESGYVEPDADCLLNDVIPDYQQADHEVEDMLRLMKKETELVIKTMRTMRDNYVKVDDEKSKETPYSGS